MSGRSGEKGHPDSFRKPMTSKDRGIRIEAHKMHVVAMLQSVAIRNKWCNNLLLKVRSAPILSVSTDDFRLDSSRCFLIRYNLPSISRLPASLTGLNALDCFSMRYSLW